MNQSSCLCKHIWFNTNHLKLWFWDHSLIPSFRRKYVIWTLESVFLVLTCLISMTNTKWKRKILVWLTVWEVVYNGEELTQREHETIVHVAKARDGEECLWPVNFCHSMAIWKPRLVNFLYYLEVWKPRSVNFLHSTAVWKSCHSLLMWVFLPQLTWHHRHA